MTFSSIQSKFDEFQQEAVLATLHEFESKLHGRYLLVIPTGGGKTFTAVKTINKLFERGTLDPLIDRVMWTAHRIELIDQAEDTFILFEDLYPDEPSFKDLIDFKMISSAPKHLRQKKQIKLVVLDEAHHGAANSYLPLFEHPNLGVLGLTATPSRHDGQPLDFEKESYSIGFPDLVEIGVIIRPEVRTVSGGKFDIVNIKDKNQLNVLNDERRNEQIIKAILQDPNEYKKIVIYTGTKKHAEDLHAQLVESPLAELYDSISFIHGGKNGRGEERKEFLVKEKKWKRSILVNCGILSEGYDDPTINTVIMAAPTNSKLVYMQAIGRAVRKNKDDELKKAYILEIHDELPNIRYRIDNRWLYADISDALEPDVIDKEYGHESELLDIFEDLYDSFQVEQENRHIPDFMPNTRYGLLLFKVYKGEDEYVHHPLVIDNANRQKVLNFFNFLSERMRSFDSSQINDLQVMKMARAQSVEELCELNTQHRVFDAMRNSVRDDEHIQRMSPWITYVAFRVRRRGTYISESLKEFLASLVNEDEITKAILEKAYPENGVLVRLPLPLNDFLGTFLTKSEFELLDATIEALRQLKEEHQKIDHRREVRDLMDSRVIPLEIGHAESLTTIIRESIEYFISLD